MPFRRARTKSVIASAALVLLLGSISMPASADVLTTSSINAVHLAGAKQSTVQKWAAKKYGTFATKTYQGTGDAVVSLPKGAKAGIVKSSSHGDSNFIVWTLNRDNSVRELVANGLGEYSAAMAFGLGRKSTATQMQVQATGSWTLIVAPVRSAGSITGSHSNQGVYLYAGGAKRLKTTNDGTSNFIIWEYGSPTGSMHLVANAYGTKKSTGTLYRGPSVLDVSAQGTWSASVR